MAEIPWNGRDKTQRILCAYESYLSKDFFFTFSAIEVEDLCRLGWLTDMDQQQEEKKQILARHNGLQCGERSITHVVLKVFGTVHAATRRAVASPHTLQTVRRGVVVRRRLGPGCRLGQILRWWRNPGPRVRWRRVRVGPRAD